MSMCEIESFNYAIFFSEEKIYNEFNNFLIIQEENQEIGWLAHTYHSMCDNILISIIENR